MRKKEAERVGGWADFVEEHGGGREGGNDYSSEEQESAYVPHRIDFC